MGVFYTGFDYKNRKNGYFKIGETSDSTPAARLAQIRRYDSFQCLGYLVLKGETKSERLYVESYVRLKLSQHPDLFQTQNDHFAYLIESNSRKYAQAQEYADYALQLAEEACKSVNIKYSYGTKIYKRS